MTETGIPSDHDLLVRLKMDDKAACDRLFARFSEPFYRYARKHRLTHEQADDAVQETFLKIFTRIDSYKDEFRSGARWMWGIHAKTCIDVFRGITKDHNLMQRIALKNSECMPTDNAYKELLAERELIAHDLAFEQLTPDEQQATKIPKPARGDDPKVKKEALARLDELTGQIYRELFGE